MSNTPPPWLLQKDENVYVHLLISPRASQNAIQGVHDQRLKVALKAPPTDGAANKALIHFLSKILSIPKGRIQLKAGHTHRRKTVVLLEYPLADAMELLHSQ